MGNYQNAGAGLKKMFIAEVGTIICAVLMIIPIINIFAAIALLVFGIISLVGLYGAGKDIAGCKTAFILTIVQLIVSFISGLIKTGVLHTVFNVANYVFGLLIIYFVCTSVAEVMNQVGAADISNKGLTVWKINLVCYIILIVTNIVAAIPVINIVAAVVSIITSIVSIVADIIYMIFLNQAYKALGA